MLSRSSSFSLLTLLVCSLQAGEVNAMAVAQTTSQTASETAATKPLIGRTTLSSTKN
jgi:hypothetical protein